MGGGVTGCAMLYNLAQRGVKCVLFEKVALLESAKNIHLFEMRLAIALPIFRQ